MIQAQSTYTLDRSFSCGAYASDSAIAYYCKLCRETIDKVNEWVGDDRCQFLLLLDAQ